MNLPPSAIVYDDGETIYIRQDRDRAAKGLQVWPDIKASRPQLGV